MRMFPFQRICIVGVGLIGGSVGLALRERGYDGRIIGVGRRQSTLDRALARGCIDQAETELRAGARGSELILLATPVPAILNLLRELGRLDPGQAMITDAGSTKQSIVDAAHEVLPAPDRFVGAHPMAGGEDSGPDAARADLFEGRPLVLTPAAGTDPQALQTIEEFWRALGMRSQRMEPAEHDRLVAAVSHLPHAAAVMLVQLVRGREKRKKGREQEGGWEEVASTGFRDATRMAGGDPDLWADIFLDNASAILEALDEWACVLEHLQRTLAKEDRDQLKKILASAKRDRDAWASARDKETQS